MHPVERIQRAVCEAYGIPSRLFLKELTHDVAHPRQVAMYLSRMLTRSSLNQIGRHFGGRDHTTVMHAVRKIERLYQEDPAVRSMIDSVKKGF